MTTPKISKAFLWRAVVTCLLILDYFLGTTGNPSISYGIIGFFWATLLVAIMIIASYVPASFKGREARPFFVLISMVGIFSLLLLVAAPYAKGFAAARMEAQVRSFIKDPIHNQANVSGDGRHLMVKLKTQKYSLERQAFIPTFRRMDYLLTTETGDKHLLIVTMRWNCAPEISLRRVDA